MIEKIQKWIGYWYEAHPLIRLFIITIGLALFGWKVGYPGYQSAATWWRGQQLVKAERAIEEGKMEDARNLSASVLRAGDKRVIEALRILEKSMTALQDPNRALIGRSLVFHPNASSEDRRRGFSLMLQDLPLGLVGMGWSNLPKEDHIDRQIALPFCDRLMKHNKLQEVINVIQGFEGWEKDWELSRQVIRALIANEKTESSAQAQQLIDQHWPAGNQAAGLELLEMIPVVQLDATLLPNSLKRLNSSVPREGLMIARLQYAQEKWTRLEIVDQVIQQWKDLAQKDVANFLLATGMHYKLISCYPPTSATLKLEGMAPLLIEACVKEKEWAKAMEYLQASNDQFDVITSLAWKSALFEKMEAKNDLDKVNIEITKEISSKPDAKIYLTLSEIMKIVGIKKRELQYLLDAIRLRNAPLPLFSDISPLLDDLYEQGSEASIAEVIVCYINFEPSNPLLVALFTYHSCIARNCDPSILNDTIQKLIETFDKSPHLRAVSIAIELSRGEFENAKKIADAITIDPAQLPPGYEAAIVIGRNKMGQVTMDNPQISKLRWDKMLPIEREFYRSFIDRESSDKNEPREKTSILETP